MPLSFADLEVAETITYNDLRDTLKDYVEIWATISDRVVISILNRVQGLTEDNLRELEKLSLIWAKSQNKRNFKEEAYRYLEVMLKVSSKLDELKI